MLIAPDLQPHVHSTPAHCELKGCAATGSRYSPGKALEGYQHGPSAWHWGLEWLICGWLRGCLFCFGWRLAWLFWGGLNDGSKMPEVQVAAWLKWYYGRAIKNQWNCEVNYRSSYQPSTKRLQDAFECFRPLQRGKQRPEHYHFNCENARFAFSHWICSNHSTWHIS